MPIQAKNFFWGAATSAHQVEGGNHNDWTEWETENAKTKTQNAKLREWPNYILKNYPNPLQEENYISGRACDHYNRFREDFDIARHLGHNAHRFSIEWSRIEPEEGRFDEREIEHYRDVIRALRERGMEPFVTLWHWTIPIWLCDRGGVKSSEFSGHFVRFVRRVVSEYKNEVNFWITLNEPMVYAKISYLEGRWPPQKKNIFSFLRVSKNLIRAHKAAFKAIKQIKPNVQVGIAHNMSFFEIEKNNFLNRILKKFGDWRKNFGFLDAIADHQDFIGFNYYSHYCVNLGFYKIKTERVSDMGWSMYPKGIYFMLNELKKYNKPIFITENGLADTRDENRAWFITEHLRWMSKAIEGGVEVGGYFHWSLLDNFEWSDGFWPRFGLVDVDYMTLKRTIRKSAYAYTEIIKKNEVETVEKQFSSS